MSVKVCKILIGIPGSGKSTYRKKEVVENGATYTNMDEIRISLRKSGNKMPKQQFEKEVKHTKLSKLEDLFKHGEQYVIVDDTHLSTSAINPVVALANKYGYTIEYKFMETSFNILKCHKNNMMRDHSEHVPVQVIETMAESFYKIWFKDYTKDVVVNSDRKKAIIVDIDGTASHMTTRGPFDWHRVDEDIPDETIRKLVNFYHDEGYEVLFVSGRDGICYEKTNNWLCKHNFKFNTLLMRPIDDNRTDILIKAEIYKNYIMQHYDVSVVFDDRLQVVRFWRGIGIKTLQCQSGWF